MDLNLFQTGKFKLHSGKTSNFKINCDALTDDDLETFAQLISNNLDWNIVIGVPTGGKALANKLVQYNNPKSINVLIVDDVLTTGASMEQYQFIDFVRIGVVIFARGPCPDWIAPIFQMWEK